MDWVDFVKELNIVQLAAIGTMFLFFYNRLVEKIDKIDTEWKEESRKMDQRVTETNKRMDGVYHILLSRINPKTDP